MKCVDDDGLAHGVLLVCSSPSPPFSSPLARSLTAHAVATVDANEAVGAHHYEPLPLLARQ